MTVLRSLFMLAVLASCATTRAAQPSGDYRHATGGLTDAEAAADRPVALLEQLRGETTIAQVFAVLGKPHGDACSGFYCPVGYFEDGTYLSLTDVGPEQRIRPIISKCDNTPCRRGCFFEGCRP